MMEDLKPLIEDWEYDKVSIGFRALSGMERPSVNRSISRRLAGFRLRLRIWKTCALHQ